MSRAGGPERSKARRAQDLAEISRRAARGEAQREIAEATGLSQQMVSVELKRLHAAWREVALDAITEARAFLLAKLDHIESQAWIEWDRSKEPRVVRSARSRRRGGRLVPVSLTVVSEERLGDVRYLDVISRCIELRGRLLGLISAQRGPGAAASVGPLTIPPAGPRLAALIADPEMVEAADALLERLRTLADESA